ncbi:MAG: TIGR04282 family arsenosugar biosynthesis glycosyltransferase [Cyclobacteriaceae bacterium]|jgi:rSAM/selenodomain-associated transferase 1|nr:TIGR04282 family arsenosugar biosynthesis glycosyltransferase [Cyclobacteriaceae bacterium]
MHEQKNLLLVFYKNPEPGKVKTRLAATVGNKIAVQVYQKLVTHTASLLKNLDATVHVYYADEIRTHDIWPDSSITKKIQFEGNLGLKMSHAFEESFVNGFEKVCIIGTDCLELTAPIIQNAFELLNKNDFVIGPAKDGGYYLLGMKKLEFSLFENKNWSTHTVLHDTLFDILRLEKTYALLPLLSDVDVEGDLPKDFLQNL